MKSCGRAPTLLTMTALQVGPSVIPALTGDDESADGVELTPRETGVLRRHRTLLRARTPPSLCSRPTAITAITASPTDGTLPTSAVWRVRIRCTVEAGSPRIGPILAGPACGPGAEHRQRLPSRGPCGAGSCAAGSDGPTTPDRPRTSTGGPTCGRSPARSPSRQPRERPDGRKDPLDQQLPAMNSQPGIMVGHEDLQCGAVLDSSTTPEVFAFDQDPRVNNARDQYT